MYSFNEIQHNSMEIILRLKIFIYMLEIDFFRNPSQRILGILNGDFWGLGCLNDAQAHSPQKQLDNFDEIFQVET